MDRLGRMLAPYAGATRPDYLLACIGRAELRKPASNGQTYVYDDKLVRLIAFSISIKVASLARLLSDDPEIVQLERVVQQAFAAGEMFVAEG